MRLNVNPINPGLYETKSPKSPNFLFRLDLCQGGPYGPHPPGLIGLRIKKCRIQNTVRQPLTVHKIVRPTLKSSFPHEWFIVITLSFTFHHTGMKVRSHFTTSTTTNRLVSPSRTVVGRINSTRMFHHCTSCWCCCYGISGCVVGVWFCFVAGWYLGDGERVAGWYLRWGVFDVHHRLHLSELLVYIFHEHLPALTTWRDNNW